VRGDGDSVEKHKEFYDEYLAVMDLAAEYYLQTIDQVFVKHQLPKGEMFHRGQLIDMTAIRHVALMTIEGEKDDITGAGQTEAALHLCTNLPRSKKLHYTQPGVGHYGIFNGSRYKQEVLPRVVAFMAEHDVRGGALRWLWHRLAGERDVAAPPEPLPPETKTETIDLGEPMRLSALPAKPSMRLRKGRRARLSARQGKASIARKRGR
jgi:poly(3-hydroxybutyrate) depolymerase